MLQRLRNDSAEPILQGIVDGLDGLERQADASSWDKAGCYVAGYDELRQLPEFAGLRGKALTQKINKSLRAVADAQRKTIPALAFLSHARTLADLWGELFGAGTKFFSYDSYRQIAVCSLPREQKDQIKQKAEREQPTREELRLRIREAVDAHRGIYWPDFKLKVSNFWKFDSPHDNGGYGGIHPEVVANLLYWFTEPDDVVIDPMAGSGVLADTLIKYRFFRESYEAEGSGPRIGLMSDLKPARPDVLQADATHSLPFKPETAALVILDPPYLRIADNKGYENLGKDLKQWLPALDAIIKNAIGCLRPGGAIAVMADDVLRKNEHCPIAIHIAGLISAARLRPVATIYNHTPNFVFSMGPAQMKAARTARLHVNGCKVIQIARKEPALCLP